MAFLDLLRTNKPSTSAQLREALSQAEAAAEAGAAKVAAGAEARRTALLGDDDQALDRIEQDLRLAEREADRADLAAAELRQRLAAAEAAEARAALDRVHEEGRAALERGVKLIRNDYLRHALALKALAEELASLEAAITAANEKLEKVGDERRVPALDTTARPRLPGEGLRAPLWAELRLPSSEHGIYPLHPAVDAHGFPIPDAQRPAR